MGMKHITLPNGHSYPIGDELRPRRTDPTKIEHQTETNAIISRGSKCVPAGGVRRQGAAAVDRARHRSAAAAATDAGPAAPSGGRGLLVLVPGGSCLVADGGRKKSVPAQDQHRTCKARVPHFRLTRLDDRRRENGREARSGLFFFFHAGVDDDEPPLVGCD